MNEFGVVGGVIIVEMSTNGMVGLEGFAHKSHS